MIFPYRQIRIYLTAAVAIGLTALILNVGIRFRFGSREPSTPYSTETSPQLDIVSKHDAASGLKWPHEIASLFQPNGLSDYRNGGYESHTPEWAKRFRLLGTVLGVETTGPRIPLAVLDDRQHPAAWEQRIVRPGERIDPDIRVERILARQVLLRNASGEQARLWLGESAGDPKAKSDPQTMPSHDDDQEDPAKAFGGTRLVDSNQWVFDRDRLMQYYAELRDNPERMLSVFDSMKPVYESDGGISGYRLHIEGEAPFFEAVGLEPGDIVRSVNHVPMHSRLHAEHFIARVVAEGLDTIAMEIEREGDNRKYIYRIAE